MKANSMNWMLYAVRRSRRAASFAQCVALCLLSACAGSAGFLITAVDDNDRGALESYLNAGLDVNARFGRDETPLIRAVRLGHFELADYILERGADIDHPNGWGHTAVHVAAQDGLLEAMNWLKNRNADLNRPGEFAGLTALHMAAERGHADVTSFLLRSGARPSLNAGDESGNTPLHYAGKQKDLTNARILVKAGADRHQKNKAGQTAAQFAGLGFGVNDENFLESDPDTSAYRIDRVELFGLLGGDFNQLRERFFVCILQSRPSNGRCVDSCLYGPLAVAEAGRTPAERKIAATMRRFGARRVRGDQQLVPLNAMEAGVVNGKCQRNPH